MKTYFKESACDSHIQSLNKKPRWMLTLEDHLETDKFSHFKCKPETSLYVATQRKECLMLTFFF